ncbi:MAG: CocE/NonD family hydrolase [Solirubrobacterales bacterium]
MSRRGRAPISRRHGALAGLLALAALALGIGATAASAGTPVGFSARGSVEQAYVTGATPGAKLSLLDSKGKVLQTRAAGSLGGIVYRHVEPGSGYRVRQGGPGGPRSPAFGVLTRRSAPPRTSVYDQTLPAGGYGYLRTRDGTKLAINVTLPSGPGPYPTLVEYSGYGYANPGGGESSIQLLLQQLGFAVVDVNMRGTGCSGGAFDFFEPLQGLDGYDVIETVSRQPWALHHKVGMAGVSYGGISQLFTAQTRPPHLAAITPLSVIDNTQTTLYPGGILNTGFALSWGKQRVHDALPASPTGGQAWAYKRIQDGDAVCAANQTLHTEAVDLLGKIDRNRYYRPKVADPLAPYTFVHKIDVPVFLACQWTDEQTGGHCPNLADEFTGTKRRWFTFTNGVHTDALAPATFNRWFDFLELYVAHRKPQLTAGQKALAPLIYLTVFGIPGVTLPDDPIQAKPDFASAKAAYEKLPRVRVLFDNGAGGANPGYPYAGFERSFSRWPIPGTKARSWYLTRNGAMVDRRPGRSGTDAFTWDPGARPPTDFTGNTGTGGLWAATPDYHWEQSPAGRALSYLSAPLKSNTTVIGAGALEAWIRARVPDVDLQVTVSEVRPDGKEVFVQSGWLKTIARRLDPKKSTLLEPVLSLRKRDLRPLPKGKFAKVTVPLYYQGHAYRKGSRIRVMIQAPGGDQPSWEFGEALPSSPTRVALAHSSQMPSRLVLPVIPGVKVPTGLPHCPGLRGEPCRDYERFTNLGARRR